jgi:hypothetical protein
MLGGIVEVRPGKDGFLQCIRVRRTPISRYIQFTDTNNVDNTILVEVDEEEVSPPEGMVKAGVDEVVEEVGEAIVARASSTFDGALEHVVRLNTEAFLRAVHNLSELPNQVDVSFGCKVTGEVGNFAIAKGGGEANYTIKLSWNPSVRKERHSDS